MAPGETSKKQVQEFPGGSAIKDLGLSLLRYRFDPWLRNFCMPPAWKNKQTKTENEKTGVIPQELKMMSDVSLERLGTRGES